MMPMPHHAPIPVNVLPHCHPVDPILIRAESPREKNHISHDTNIAYHYSHSSPKRHKKSHSASHKRTHKHKPSKATFSFANESERPMTSGPIHTY